MTDVRALLERAIANERLGEREAARTLYDQVLAVAPEHPGALLKLALFDQAAGDMLAARARLDRALRAARSSRLATAPIQLAYAKLHEHGNDWNAARAAYERALAEVPGHPAATFGLGQLALRDGDAREAIGRFRAVLARQPDDVPARAQLASALFAQGAFADAAAELAPAINAIPASAPLRLLAANIALRRSDFAGAIEHGRAGLAVVPGHGGLLTALGHALRATGAADGAAAAFGEAAAVAPDDAAAWLASGNACMEAELARVDFARRAPTTATEKDQLADALAAFARAAALQPNAVAAQAHLAMAARYACDWPRTSAAVRALGALHAADPVNFACSPMMAVALLSDSAALKDGIAGWSRQSLPPPQAPAVISRRGDRLRVGYLSTDFHDHATAHLAAGLFELHDGARFDTFAYAADRDDGSAMRRRLRQAFAHWRDIRAIPDGDAATLIRDDALDVLVDLKGHTHGTRIALLAERPAPVQIHYLGFPGTLAYGAVDGFVADAIVAPQGSETEFTEALLRLPVCYQVNDSRRPLPEATTRSAAGLPDNALVLACFNQAYKLTEPFVTAWLAALREQAGAVLWLTVPHALARHNLRSFAEGAGVAPERIVFAPVVPQSEHIARLRCADLALDVLPYGSHTTGSDALWAGVPLLTCRGTTFAGRVGASLCHAVELPELVTESVSDYAEQLQRLCADRSRLAHYRQHLESGRTRLPLFDTAAFTRAFERMLEDAAIGKSGERAPSSH